MINKEVLSRYAGDIGVQLDDKALELFDIYAGELVAWNEKMNLTAITESDEIVVKHFIDCLMILKYADLFQGAKIIDTGTGAGFPGIPLLIARQDLDATLVDSLNKRLVFIENVMEKCTLNAQLVHARAEELGQKAEYREAYDFAAARAVAPMNVLAEYCLPFVKVGGYFVALKGSSDDITPAMHAIAELGGEITDIVSYKLPNGDARSIAIIKKISHTSTKYPRKSKKIATAPL